MPAKPIPRPWRRFLRFSVRGMIVLVLVVGGWLGWIVRGARVQRKAVAAIEQAGGYVRYHSEVSNSNSLRRRRLVVLFGIDYYHDYVDYVYSARVWNDPALEQAGHLYGIVELYAEGSSVTDAGLVHLAGQTNLNFLDLEETQVSDTGLVHLMGLNSLSVLGLRGTRITDAGLEHLRRLKTLEFLSVSVSWRPHGGPTRSEAPATFSNVAPNEPRVTAKGISKLQQLLPSLNVNR